MKEFNYVKYLATHVFGSVKKMSEATNTPLHTVYSWIKRDSIPAYRMVVVDMVLDQKGVTRPTRAEAERVFQLRQCTSDNQAAAS